MIRCSECKHFTEKPIQTKVFYYCGKKFNDIGCSKIWNKPPKAHPRWCPLWKESKNAERRE